MTDGEFLQWVIEVTDTGGPIAGAALAIGAAWWKWGRPSGGQSEKAMVEALNALQDQVKENQDANERHHVTAERHREDMKDSIAALAERVARMEGMLDRRSR